jgi:hypothetical protein
LEIEIAIEIEIEIGITIAARRAVYIYVEIFLRQISRKGCVFKDILLNKKLWELSSISRMRRHMTGG